MKILLRQSIIGVPIVVFRQTSMSRKSSKCRGVYYTRKEQFLIWKNLEDFTVLVSVYAALP
jgi:hypothetical protein